MITPWHTSEQQLKFQLGDLNLFTISFPVIACELGVTDDTIEQNGISIEGLPRVDSNTGYVVRGAPVEDRLPTITVEGKYIHYVTTQYKRYYISLNQSFEEYKAGFRSKTRSTIQRKVRKFERDHSNRTDFRVYRSPDELDEFFRLAKAVSDISYQERLLDAGLPSAASTIKCIKKEADGGNVRGYLLLVDGCAVSYLLLIASGRTIIYKYLGYLTDYISYSVGTVLHWKAIENLLSEKCFDFLDFTEGEGEQKRLFSTGYVKCANTYILNNTMKNKLIIRMHMVFNNMSCLLGKGLDGLGIKSKIRKLIRRAAI